MDNRPHPTADSGDTGNPSAKDQQSSLAPPGADWPAQAADAIERAVGAVRDRTTGPAITVARAVVYGTFALLAGSAALVMVAIAAVRALDAYLPDAVFGEEHTWAAHLVVGAVFSLVGMILWSRRTRRAESAAE